jgi:SynChlorMet cassette radical SAM/SPASM protein ScmF
VENSLSLKTKLPLYYSHPPAFQPLGKMFGNKGGACGVCGILGILGVLSNGTYALCGIGQTVPEFIFGDAAKDKLEKVWNNTPILQELRQGMPWRLEGICAECAMKNRCFGNCVAQNYYSSKSIWAGYWYCEEADKKGLFPATRKRLKLCEV